jgi:small GTP-binding protein
MAAEPPTLKLLMIGDSTVGKSWLLARYSAENKALKLDSSLPTIGIDFKIKRVTIDDQKVKLQIWDTAGQERYRTITTSYYRGSQGIIIVYDITNLKSFQACRNWLSQIQMHADANVSKILVGNKCDLQEKREVSYEDALSLAREFKMELFETSAKDDINVEKAFETVAQLAFSKVGSAAAKVTSIAEKKVTKLSKDPPKKRGFC